MVRNYFHSKLNECRRSSFILVMIVIFPSYRCIGSKKYFGSIILLNGGLLVLTAALIIIKKLEKEPIS